MLIICRHIFKFKLIKIILFVIFNTIKRYLYIFRCSSSALSDKICNNFSFIYFSYALNWEGPKDFLANHDQNFALIHTACIWNKRKWNLKDTK